MKNKKIVLFSTFFVAALLMLFVGLKNSKAQEVDSIDQSYQQSGLNNNTNAPADSIDQSYQQSGLNNNENPSGDTNQYGNDACFDSNGNFLNDKCNSDGTLINSNNNGTGADPNIYGDDACFDSKGNLNTAICDSSGRLIISSGGKSGDRCQEGAHFYSRDTCATGFTCNSGVCEQSWLGSTFGVGQGADNQSATPEEQAAAKKKQQEATLNANSAAAAQQAAIQNVNNANARVVAACTNQESPECVAAKTAADKANQDLLAANAKLSEAQTALQQAQQQLSQLQSGGGGNGGGGNVNMVANGIMGPVTQQGVGGNGGYGGGGLPGNYNTGLSGNYNLQKCGTNFTEIGGVCFPSNTGLSSAPIYVILSNIFSWMMGLFTTLSVVAFVISGIQYLVSSGDEDLAKSAKKNANNAVLGIIIGLSGFIVIKAIAAALAGSGYFF